MSKKRTKIYFNIGKSRKRFVFFKFIYFVINKLEKLQISLWTYIYIYIYLTTPSNLVNYST